MGGERRKHARVDVNVPAFIEDVETGRQTEIRFQELSKSGACFLCEFELVPGDWVVLQLGDGLVVTGRVMRVEPLFEDRYGVSIRFAQSNAVDETNETLVPGDSYQLELKELNEEAFNYYPRLKRVQEFVEESYCEPLTLEDVAEVAAMEKTYFSSFFHQKIGVTFRVWLQYVRIKKALELLSTRDQSITDVAFAVGFGELSTFQKAFKRWTNLTPRDFKKINRPS